ncbi:OmpH family outer membrane protein [Aurantiacibacter spongiae]|uniref:OmpH family outer membrane protein n=1 Tax=Aurantiacibacter spongiae TaxID=2488860 RepID=A0A3N5D0F3_9SPHN|nr:OmpH family outer membrane protein [Aurantiacibacter spongiae]RPF72479.1 OmpH family outer membrane protein [Aurantiacibacter spongiae]
MKSLTKIALAAGLATTATAAPASAQVNGIGTSDLPIAVVGSQAFQTGYQQIATQYQAQRTTVEQRQQQRTQLVQQLDTNGDGQLSEDEANAAPQATVQQVQAIDQEIQQIQRPINLARIYVVQQVAQQYAPALQQVVSAQNVQIVLTPDAIVYAPEAANLTPAVVQALNTRVPSVQITPPAGYQPSEAAVGLFQQVQQVLLMAQMQQAQQQAQTQTQQPATSGR